MNTFDRFVDNEIAKATSELDDELSAMANEFAIERKNLTARIAELEAQLATARSLSDSLLEQRNEEVRKVAYWSNEYEKARGQVTTVQQAQFADDVKAMCFYCRSDVPEVNARHGWYEHRFPQRDAVDCDANRLRLAFPEKSKAMDIRAEVKP